VVFFEQTHLLSLPAGVVYITEFHPKNKEVLVSVSGKGDDWQSLRT
jgi:hypothetical protein